MGCRIRKATHWTIRATHEGQMHQQKSFVTLTYADKYLPENYSLNKDDPDDFMRAIRRAFGPGIRVFGCGEYGDDGRRPHYHAILYGLDFNEDRTLWKKTKSGKNQYTSLALSKAWPWGLATLGEAETSSMAYCAGYVTKKIGGPSAAMHYRYRHPNTGRLCKQLPEFAFMSRMPGIGKKWLDKYGLHALQRGGKIAFRQREVYAPPYYWRIWEKEHPELYAKARLEMLEHMRRNNTPIYSTKEDYASRRMIKEHVLINKQLQRKRNMQ